MDHDRPTESGPDEPAAPAAPEPATRPRATRPLSPEAQVLAAEIATALGETEPDPMGQIARAVDRLGAERARVFLAQVQEIEAGGGQMLPDDSRRRTPGGLFFLLLRRSADVSRRDKVYIFPHLFQDKKARADAGESTGTAQAPVAWTDDTYRALARQLQQHSSGRATTVKITIVGRPAKVLDRGQVIVLSLRQDTAPSLPKGLPEPATGTRYALLIAAKQWAKIAEALDADPEDALIAEGYPSLDPRFPQGITVHATSVTTKRTQAAKRATQATGGEV